MLNQQEQNKQATRALEMYAENNLFDFSDNTLWFSTWKIYFV